jgi:signal transduction histidine kinase
MDLAGETRDPLRRRLQRAWGLASAVALPLRRGGEPYGTLAVYADSRFFFDDDALRLLQDLADTVSLALDLFDREAHRQSVEAALRASEARLQEAQALCQVGDWELDRDSGRMSWSPQLFRLFERPESAGVPDLDEATAWYTPASLELTRDRYRHAIETGERSTVEQEVHLPSGRIRHHSTVIVPVPDAAGRVYKLYGTVQDITERKELERERIAHLARVGELSRHLVEAQECERRRLASELHDSASPNLAALQLTVANLAAALPPAVKCAVAPLLDDIRGLLDDTTAAIRRISTELRPATLDYAGLAALREYAEQFARRSGIAVEFVDTAPATALPPTLQLVLFRVAQEALTNCAKHAAAGRIRIELAQADGTFRMSIIDDGVGFDPELLGRQEPAPGLGLITMKERAEFAGGRFAVHSEPGRGAEIRIEFDAPLQDGALSEEQA